MKTISDKVIAVILSVILVFSVFSVCAYAQDAVQCYVDGEPSTSIYDATNNISGVHTIVVAEGVTKFPYYLEPEGMESETDELTIDLNGQTIETCIDIWPYGLCNGIIIIKNGTIIAPEDRPAIHVGDNVREVRLYDVEVYGQLDSNKFSVTKKNALSIYSGTFHDGNHDPYYSTSSPNKINVFGGTWDYDVTNYIGSGLELVEHTDGTFSVETAGDISFETDTDGAYLINNLNDLQNLRRSVDSGTSYKGKTFKLTDDIDLDGIKWNPIGSADKQFQGNFDGQGHTISNLYVKETADSIGLFATVSNSVLKDFTIKNATVLGDERAKGAGAVTGRAYSNVTIKNVNVIGKIEIEIGRYVGGINGDMSYARYENCLVDGSNDEDFESRITGLRYGKTPDEGYTNYVGGICGQLAENSRGISDCTVKNITLQANDYGVGGIAGVLQMNTIISDCEVIDVKLLSPRSEDALGWTGYIVGKNYTKSSEPTSMLINCKATYTAYINGKTEPQEVMPIGDDYTYTDGTPGTYEPNTVVGNNVVYENGKIVSGEFSLIGNNSKQALEDLLSETTELVENEEGTYVVTVKGVAKIGYVGYSTLQDAINAAGEGDTILLTDNVTEDISISSDKELKIDAAGFEYSGEITNAGVITLSDSTGNGEFKDTVMSNSGTVIAESGKFTKNGAADANYKAYLNPCYDLSDKGVVTKKHSTHIAEGTSVKPTCVLDGYEGDIVCDCGEIHENGKVLNKTGVHSFTNYVYNNDAACTLDGTKTAVCDVCGKETNTVIASGTAKGHTDKDNDKVCDVCGAHLKGYFRCSWCSKYEANKDNKLYGWVIVIIHYFVHLMEHISFVS